MICAIYARSASVMQNETKEENLKDQIVPISNWAKKNGFTIVAKYLDPGMSGFDSGRPGFNRMMADAALGKFHTLIVRDLSRLSRSSNASRVIKELNFIGVRVIAINDGIDTATPGSSRHVGFKAIMNQGFLDKIAKNVHRGLSGKATKCHNKSIKRSFK